MTLTTDFIPGLRVELVPHHDPAGNASVDVEVCDYATLTVGDDIHRSVWARKRFASPLYLISHTQLFDLLITSYRVMDEFFATGKDNRPSPLKD
jgi:hypothetical protein